MLPKLISLGFAVPEYDYSQREIFAALDYPRAFWRIFRNSGIDNRYFCVSVDRARKLSWQEQQEEYAFQAPRLSQKAILNCLDGRDPKDIGCLIYSTCTGYVPGPILPHYLQRMMGFSPSTYYGNNTGQGCESGFPGLKRAHDYVLANNKPALVVNCELSSLTYYPEPAGKPDPENDYECLRAGAVFGDAAVAALIGYDDDWRHPAIIDTETYTDTEYLDDLGYVWRNGRLRVRLSRRVPELAPLVVKPAVDKLRLRHQLFINDIKWLVIHAAGNTVLDNIRDALGIPEEKMMLSRETLRDFGNTSSTSVGITGKRLMSQDIKPGDYAMVISIGPGMTGGATLLKFGIHKKSIIKFAPSFRQSCKVNFGLSDDEVRQIELEVIKHQVEEGIREPKYGGE